MDCIYCSFTNLKFQANHQYDQKVEVVRMRPHMAFGFAQSLCAKVHNTHPCPGTKRASQM